MNTAFVQKHPSPRRRRVDSSAALLTSFALISLASDAGVVLDQMDPIATTTLPVFGFPSNDAINHPFGFDTRVANSFRIASAAEINQVNWQGAYYLLGDLWNVGDSVAFRIDLHSGFEFLPDAVPAASRSVLATVVAERKILNSFNNEIPVYEFQASITSPLSLGAGPDSPSAHWLSIVETDGRTDPSDLNNVWLWRAGENSSIGTSLGGFSTRRNDVDEWQESFGGGTYMSMSLTSGAVVPEPVHGVVVTAAGLLVGAWLWRRRP